MAFVLMGLVPLNLWVAIEGANRMGHMAMALRQAERRFMQFTEEMLSLSAVQRLLGKHSPMHATLQDMYTASNLAGSRSDYATANMAMRLVWLDALFKAFMFGYGGNEVMQGRLGYNQWASFFAAASAFTPMIPAVAVRNGAGRREVFCEDGGGAGESV